MHKHLEKTAKSGVQKSFSTLQRVQGWSRLQETQEKEKSGVNLLLSLRNIHPEKYRGEEKMLREINW